MPQPNALLITELKLPIRTFSVSRETLRGFIEVLQQRCDGALQLELAVLPTSGKPAQEVAQAQQILKDGYRLFLTITGHDGSQLNGELADIFESPNFPSNIATVFFDSASRLKLRENFTTRNSLSLFLDFRRPAVLDFRLMPSQETLNESNFCARGIDPTWVHGVFHEVESFIIEHNSSGAWLHRHTVYDVLVWLIGLPLAFWMTFRASPLALKVLPSEFLRAAFYVYVWFITLVAFRTMFHYARWLWPLVEYRRPETNVVAHRAFWSAILVGVIGSLIYDFGKMFAGL